MTPSLARKPESEGLQMIDESQYQKALLLFEQHDKIRYFVIRKYYPTLLYNEDVEQATKCGLWRAAVTYDQNKDCTFSHYAISCIMAEMVPYTRTINKHNKATDNAIKCSDRNRRPMNSPDDVLCIDLLDFLARLPSDLKIVVDYRKVGYRSEEIGQILGITKRSVDRRLVKALRMWHDFIDDSSAAEPRGAKAPQNMRLCCNGSKSASQAESAGSIPVRRSTPNGVIVFHFILRQSGKTDGGVECAATRVFSATG